MDKNKLEAFFMKVADLTFNHKDINGYAVVTADDLGDALLTIWEML